MAAVPKIDATKTHVVQELKHGNPLISCRYDPSGRYVFYGAQDYQVWRWDTKENKKVALQGTDAWVRGIAFSRDGSQVITAGYDGRLVWWPGIVRTGEPSAIFQSLTSLSLPTLASRVPSGLTAMARTQPW